MPFYEYRCTKCGHIFEEFQKISDPSIEKCPKCGGKVEKLISASGLVFKGKGFYITDYKNGGSSSKASSVSSSPKTEKKKDSPSKTNSTSSDSNNTK